MKIFQVDFDANNFQSLFPDDENLWKTGLLTLDCTLKAAAWAPPRLFCLHPLIQRGDFFGGNVGGLIASPEGTELVRTFFEMAGELLPVLVENEDKPFFLLNITDCINALDSDKSEWHLDLTSGQRLLIKKYAFHQKRFVESSLFKIPETRRGEILTIERSADPDEEFKAFVEQNDLKGLIFRELWSDKN